MVAGGSETRGTIAAKLRAFALILVRFYVVVQTRGQGWSSFIRLMEVEEL